MYSTYKNLTLYVDFIPSIINVAVDYHRESL